MTAIMESPATTFLRGLGGLFDRPRAILVVSAHWETALPALNAVSRNETIYDFRGFPAALYQLTYPAPGAPGLAGEIAQRLRAAGFDAQIDDRRGLDHGAWVPLYLAYPQADIPVLELSVQTDLGTAHHVRLGEALAWLRDEGVLIVGSGSFTHDLRRFRGQSMDAAEAPDVTAFADWMDDKIISHDVESLIDYRARAPFAADEHPSEEHLLPLYVALGAAGEAGKASRLHSSTQLGILRMDAYQWG